MYWCIHVIIYSHTDSHFFLVGQMFRSLLCTLWQKRPQTRRRSFQKFAVALPSEGFLTWDLEILKCEAFKLVQRLCKAVFWLQEWGKKALGHFVGVALGFCWQMLVTCKLVPIKEPNVFDYEPLWYWTALCSLTEEGCFGHATSPHRTGSHRVELAGATSAQTKSRLAKASHAAAAPRSDWEILRRFEISKFLEALQPVKTCHDSILFSGRSACFACFMNQWKRFVTIALGSFWTWKNHKSFDLVAKSGACSALPGIRRSQEISEEFRPFSACGGCGRAFASGLTKLVLWIKTRKNRNSTDLGVRELWKFMELNMFSMYFTTIIHVCLNGSLVSTCHHLLTCLALSNMAKAWILNCCLGCTWFLVKKDNLNGFFVAAGTWLQLHLPGGLFWVVEKTPLPWS